MWFLVFVGVFFLMWSDFDVSVSLGVELSGCCYSGMLMVVCDGLGVR